MKKVLTFIFVLISILTFTGCGKTSKTLKIALDAEDQGRYDELFDYFTAETGIEVSATYGQDVSKLIGTKDEPDIIKTSTVSILSKKSSLLDLSDLIKNDNSMDTTIYIDSIMDALTIDGKIYALPTSINTSLLYYNKTLFDNSAVELRQVLNLAEGESVYPKANWTWADFQKAGVTLSKYQILDDEVIYSQFGCETQLNWWGEWMVYVNQLGGSFYEDGSNNKVSALNSSQAIEAITFFKNKSMGDVTEKFAPNAIEASGAYSFAAGNVAMILGGHIGDWYSYEALGIDWDIQVLPTPVNNPNARGGEISADAFGISVRSRNVDNAYKFLKMWAGVEGATKMYQYNKIGALKNMEDIIKALPAEEQKDINIDALFDAIELAVTLPREENFEKVCRERVTGEIYKLFIPGRGGETDVNKVMNNIKTVVDKFYKE